MYFILLIDWYYLLVLIHLLIYRSTFIHKGKKGFFNKGKGEEDDSAEDNGKDDRKEENDDGAGIHSKHKADEGEEVSEKTRYISAVYYRILSQSQLNHLSISTIIS